MTVLARAHRTVVLIIAMAWMISGCGGDAEPVAATAVPGVATETTAIGGAPEVDAVDPSSTIAPELPAPERPYAAMTLRAAETGPNPMLTWDAVSGAVLYRLVVLDPDGRPYWAWSGAATSVHLGGSGAATVVGARVFAEMTWQVSAHDDAGVPLAVSDVGLLSP